jgi:hypothetical protein
MRAWMFLPLISGCFGVYAEVATTTYPSASLGSAGGSTSASSVGFNVGVDFGNIKRRFAMGYSSQTVSVSGGSASLAGSEGRFDFDIVSLSNRAHVRLGAGVNFSSGTSKLAGMSRSDAGGGGAYGGVDFSYFPTYHVGLHAFAGPAYGGAQLPGGNLSGTGATFRLAVTYQLSDVRPNPSHFYPLEKATDITGLIDTGAHAMGCTTLRDSQPVEGYAYVDVDCDGRKLMYFQTSNGMVLHCEHMFDKECEALGDEIVESSKKAIAKAAANAELDKAQAQGDAVFTDLKCNDDRDAAACERACNEQHLAGACDIAAQGYMQGKGVAADPARAETLYTQACDGNYAAGCFHLGSWQVMKTGKQDPTPAIAAMTKACDLGYGDGCAVMGGAYLLGQGVAKDEVAAAKFLERGCDASSSMACRTLGQAYANGLGVTKDLDRAGQLMKKACDLHDDEACKMVSAPSPAVTP